MLDEPHLFLWWRGLMYKLVVFCTRRGGNNLLKRHYSLRVQEQNAYSHCSWECLGVGQFLPGDSSNPHIGSVGMIEQVDEWRIEMLVPDVFLEPVKNALYAAHPYEGLRLI